MTCLRHGWKVKGQPCIECAHERESAALQLDLAAFACVPAALALAEQEVTLAHLEADRLQRSCSAVVTPERVSVLAYELGEAMVNERAKRHAEK